MSHGRELVDERDAARRVDEVTSALEQLTAALDEDERRPVILQRVCRQVVHAVPDTELASITLLREGAPYTAAATGDVARRIDQAPYHTGQGPCLEAARTGTLQRYAGDDAAARWPQFAAAAGTDTVAGYLSAPLFIDREHLAALNLSRTPALVFSTLVVALLVLYSSPAYAALLCARRY